MWSEFAIDYATMVFFSTLGTMQIIAAKNGLAGIMLLRGRTRLSTWLGSGVIAASTVWFFVSDFRNQPDTGDGLEANTQAAVFAIAAGAAVGVTFALASIVNHRWASASPRQLAAGDSPPSGLDVLRQTTFVLAVAARFRRVNLLWRTRDQGPGRGTEADG